MNTYTITPSWLVKNKNELLKGVKNLEKLGFRIVNKKPLFALPSPEEKAAQIHKAFADKKIGLIIARRGGYSSIKALPYIDFNLIKRNPKLFAGFSDLSTLLNAIHERTGIVTLHSPMVVNFEKASRFTVRSFMNAVNGFPEKNLFKGTKVSVYRRGTATGTLVGGNLVTLTSLIGTKWEIYTAGHVIFLEDVDEKLHQIDRYLTQWALKGKFNGIKGLVLGDFRGIKNKEVWKILSNQIKVNFPVVYCPNIGHVKDKLTLPIGAKVKLDTRGKQLTISN
ncbi:MAG: LD-carboxypeptidase [Elusimicrobiota bacterium]